MKLPTLLKGEALVVWLELTEMEQAYYTVIKKKLCSKMAPMGFISLDEFHKWKLCPGESLSVYISRFKKVLDQAMPALDETDRKELSLHQFLEGLPQAVSLQVRAAGEMKIKCNDRTNQTVVDSE